MTENENKAFKTAKITALEALSAATIPQRIANHFFSPATKAHVVDMVNKTQNMGQLKNVLEQAMTVGINVWEEVFPKETPKLYSIALTYGSDSE